MKNDISIREQIHPRYMNIPMTDSSKFPERKGIFNNKNYVLLLHEVHKLYAFTYK